MDYNSKYKERTPEETCKIILDFFENRGYEVLIHERESDIKTWSCHVLLSYNGKVILTSNGKAMTKEYSLASGLAELYERFCQFCTLTMNRMFMNKVAELNKEKGYTFVEGDKHIAPMDTLKAAPGLAEAFKEYTDEQTEILLKIQTNDDSIGLPYRNVFDENDIKYLDPRIIMGVNNSTGMSGGNSEIEAFNQGMSEIFERYVAPFFLMDTIDHYYVVKNDCIKNEQLKEKIRLIEKSNKKVYIIDFSYNFGIPVVGVIVLDKSNLRVILDLGCFPVFDIALERCFTEMWQNVIFMSLDKDAIEIPFRSESYRQYIERFTSGYGKVAYLSEEVFNKMIYEDSFNKEYYVPTNSTNEEIFDFYKGLIKKNNLEIYYRNNGLIDEMASIQIVPINLNVRRTNLYYNQDNEEIDWDHIKDMTEKNNMVINELMSPDMDTNKILNYLMNRKLKNNELRLFGRMFYRDWSNPLGGDGSGCLTISINELEDLMYRENPVEEDKERTACFYTLLRKFVLIERYKIAGYTYPEVRDFLGLFGQTVTEEDFLNCDEVEYLYSNIYVKPANELYLSQEYEDIVKTFLK